METSWKFYTRTALAWDAMYDACAQAQMSIDFETYIFENDAIGTRFIELFKKKITQGVRIRLLCDMVGSFNFVNSSLPAELSKLGVQIAVFNPINPWRIGSISSWFFRNHRKILLVDAQTMFTGGIGIRDEMRLWRDTQVCITGEVVKETERAFERMWKMVLIDKFLRFEKPRLSASHFNFVTNSPHVRQRFIHKWFLAAIRNAKESVCITTPYFIPDPRFMRVLRLAAHRNVAVKLIVPKRSDHDFVDRVSDSHITSLLRSGVRVYKYTEGILHAKTMVIDDDWASVGSSNIDNLSFIFNYEGNIVSSDRAFVGELKEHFHNDLAGCDEVSSDGWHGRPFVNKMLELVYRPFGAFL